MRVELNVRNVVEEQVQGGEPERRVVDCKSREKSTIATAGDPYDMDLLITHAKPKQTPPASNSCTCNNTCEGCNQTDNCGNSHYCATNNRCGHTDDCR